jgi:hypothetical protein
MQRGHVLHAYPNPRAWIPLTALSETDTGAIAADEGEVGPAPVSVGEPKYIDIVADAA